MASAMNEAWSFNKWWVAVGTVIVLAFVIIGGVKRIATFASIVVPFMALVYIALALLTVLLNADQVPAVFETIFASAFGADSAFGAIIGSAVMWGVKRGIYSNEAGQGTGPHAAAAAEVSHPAKQGLVQAFAVYVDTLFICSATGFLILTTGAYRVFEGESDGGPVLADGGILPENTEVGPAYAQAGFDTLWSGAGSSFIAVSLLGKAATIDVPYIRGTVGSNATMLLQALILVSVVIGAVGTATEAWVLGDIGVGLMAWFNIVGIIILQQPAYRALRDFERQKKAGLDPVFDPRALDIAGATFWETYRPTTGPTTRVPSSG
jgi:AGCS family alanine or glycine:cation symporter